VPGRDASPTADAPPPTTPSDPRPASAITSTEGQAPNNHFWYHRQDTNKLELIVWDPNVSFDGFRTDGGAFTSSLSIWHRFEVSKATSWIRADPTASATYQKEIARVRDGPFTAIPARMDRLYALIRAHVYADRRSPSPTPPSTPR
jgi:hypothetical protein